ncbi:Protein CBG00473 [Caenorhabditis briggsae]|uniref:Protein CBG00473 n=1 Tax=Caenorhabditis briggsae TaxID=6238 RepID=A8WMR0_CAEBR|nr:Protein CBG00473 [Caenorhabditis briggsae]CAP21765.2 Protein CBG00473 [Caenorhabditis briggsae]
MNTNTYMDVYGIVVGRKIPNLQFFIWCKESGSDLVLQMDQRKPVELGTWVHMYFNGSEYQNPNFLIHDYVVVTPIYKTEVIGHTVRLQLEQYLNNNLKELDHWFFGKIYNNRNKEFAPDVYYLTIKKIRQDGGDIWVMESVDKTEPKQPNVSGIIGIVSGSGKKNNKYFVWCKERKADYDVVIFSENANIQIGTWLKLNLSLDQLSQEYLECPNFTVIPYPVHTTFPSKNNQLCLTLELDIPEGSQNLSHPFVGEIINIIEPFRQTGRYSITIMRKKIGTQIGWFLTAKQLKQPKDLIEPIQYTINLQHVARHHISRRDVLEPDSPPQTAPRYSRNQHQTDILGSQFDTLLNTTNRPSTSSNQPGNWNPVQTTRTSRPQRSSSRPRNETSAQTTTSRQRSSSRPRNEVISSRNAPWHRKLIRNFFQIPAGPPAPRQRSTSRPRHHENPIRPILKQQLRPRSLSRVQFQSSNAETPNVELTGIVVAESPYFFYVWCRERLPGLDLAIPKSESRSLTDWIQFSITRDELDSSFPSDPKFQIREVRRITSKFPTDLSKTGKSVTIKIDMEIERNPRIEDIHHDVMGLIINEKFKFEESGRYTITISRFKSKKEENPRSVWHLKFRELAPPTPMPSQLPVADESNRKRAIILNISNFEHHETINVWILDVKQQGIVKLNAPTEKLNLAAGDMFEADLSNTNGTWFSSGPITKVKNSYTTRPSNNSGQVEILLSVKVVSDSHPSYRCSWIDHEHFGDISFRMT